MNASRVHILVVDDEEEYRTVLQIMLRNIGHTCELAVDVFEAMDKIGRTKFDIVISDIRMPRKDGIQLMREALQAYPDLKFIIMTGHAADYSYSDIIAAGATDFIGKPFEFGKLKAKIERIQREQNILRRLKQANDRLAAETMVNASFAELSRELVSSRTFGETGRLVLDYAKRLTESPVGYTAYMDQKTGDMVDPSIDDGSNEDYPPHHPVFLCSKNSTGCGD
jgi:DNA-binding NtrC family response regulator